MVIVLSLAAVTYSCMPNEKPAGYKISGEVTGFADSTWLYFDVNKHSDSTMIINGKFSFAGSLGDSIKVDRGFLRTKDRSDYKFLWMENSEITMNAEKGNFRYAKITGSKTQSEDDKYNNAIAPYMHKDDSLLKLINVPGVTEARIGELREQRGALADYVTKESLDFIKGNPNSLVSASLLLSYVRRLDKKTSYELYNLFSEENKNSAYGKDINEYLTLSKELKIGDKFADFEQASYNGEKIKLSDFAGKVVLLEFWAAWCGPCRKENPQLVKTYKAYKDKGFEILGVSLDGKGDKEKWMKAIENDGLIWKHVSELNQFKNTAAIMYGVSGIPANFLIDKTGTIVARDLRGKKLGEKLAELFK